MGLRWQMPLTGFILALAVLTLVKSMDPSDRPKPGMSAAPSRQVWTLDFVPLETSLRRVEFNADGFPVASPSLLKALEATLALLPPELPPDEFERALFLTLRSFPIAGARLADFLERLQAYRTQHDKLIQTQRTPGELFAAELELQDLVFGESAGALLFERQRALRRLILLNRNGT